MIKVYKVPSNYVAQLSNLEFEKDYRFNPTLDAEGNYFISEEEAKQIKKSEFNFVKEFEKINFKRKSYPVINE